MKRSIREAQFQQRVVAFAMQAKGSGETFRRLPKTFGMNNDATFHQ